MRLQLGGGSMSIPVSLEGVVVGREAEVQRAVTALVGGRSTVLVHGLAGVGKDVVATKVVRDPALASVRPALAAWLQGSTAAGLCSQLISLFSAHRPDVLVGHADEEAQLASIKAWLAANPDSWLLVVEDVTSSCRAALAQCLPAGAGRLLLTSQEAVHQWEGNPLGVTLPLELRPLSNAQCREVWRGMNIFSSEALATLSEAELEARCGQTGGAVPYEAPGAGETAKSAKARRRKLCRQLHEHEELSTEGLDAFFEHKIGNLPLTVQLLGNVLRADQACHAPQPVA